MVSEVGAVRTAREGRETWMNETGVVERALGVMGVPSSSVSAGGVTRVLSPNYRRLVTDGKDPQGRRDRFRLANAILDDVAEGVLVTRAGQAGAPEQEIVYANGAFADLTGYSLGEVIGRTPRAILGPRTDPSCLREIEDALCQSRPVRAELCCHRKDGTAFWNEISVSPVRGDRGEVAQFVWVQRDTTERKAIVTRLAEEVLRDPLTGLPNRSLLTDVLGRALQRSDRSGRRVAVLFADLDDFKSVNDAFGHAVGDQILMAVARRLRGALRAGDTAARLGGDEFVAVLGEIAQAREAIEVEERIERTLRAPFRLGSLEIFATASVGMVLSGGPERVSPEELVRAADAAMYENKRTTKGRHEGLDEGPRGSTGRNPATDRPGLTGVDVGGIRVGGGGRP